MVAPLVLGGIRLGARFLPRLGKFAVKGIKLLPKVVGGAVKKFGKATLLEKGLVIGSILAPGSAFRLIKGFGGKAKTGVQVLAGDVPIQSLIQKTPVGDLPIPGVNFTLDPTQSLPKDPSFFQQFKAAFQAAGLIGLGAAAVPIIGGIIGKKGKGKDPSLDPTPTLPSTFFQLPAQIQPQIQASAIQPLGAVEKPPEDIPKEVPMAVIPTINVKTIVKPEINIRINQSKKFINQQNRFIV